MFLARLAPTCVSPRRREVWRGDALARCLSRRGLRLLLLALALLLGLISFMLCKPQLLLPALVVFDLDFTLVR